LQEETRVGATRAFNLAVVGVWAVATISIAEGSNRVGNALDVGWLTWAGKILVFLFWLVPVGHCLTAGRFATVERILLRPMSVMVGVTYASIVWLGARLGPGRELFRGIAHLRAGRLEQAATAFDRHLKRKPRDLAGLAHATMCLMKLARHEEALGYLDSALRQKGGAEVLWLRALVLNSSGATEDALRDIDAAIALRPKNRAFHYYRALVLIGGGRIDEALEVLEGPASPAKCPFSWYLLGVVLSAKGEADRAAGACSHALPIVKASRLLGATPWAQLAEAQVLSQMDRLEQAEGAIARTLITNPGDHEALTLQAIIHCRRGERDKALQVLEQAGRRNPFSVVTASRDALLAPLRSSPGFASLVEQATRDWQARLLAIRQRPGIAPSGAAN
jgi:tetratricopeptide (TPR) repeat protein